MKNQKSDRKQNEPSSDVATIPGVGELAVGDDAVKEHPGHPGEEMIEVPLPADGTVGELGPVCGACGKDAGRLHVCEAVAAEAPSPSAAEVVRELVSSAGNEWTLEITDKLSGASPEALAKLEARLKEVRAERDAESQGEQPPADPSLKPLQEWALAKGHVPKPGAVAHRGDVHTGRHVDVVLAHYSLTARVLTEDESRPVLARNSMITEAQYDEYADAAYSLVVS